MSEKLKPCPFCGSKYVYTHHYIMVISKICPMCGATGPSAKTEDEAEELWNRRVEVKGEQ